MVETEMVSVEVIYALPDQQALIKLKVEKDTTVLGAIEKSGMLTRYPEIDLSKNKVGIFGKVKSPESGVNDGDRIEIYRPLIADPKEARKRRADKKHKQK